MRDRLPEACRLCGRKVRPPEIIGQVVYGGKPEQKFYRCPHCEVAFLFPPMTEAEERGFYTGEFEKFMEARSGGDLDWSGPESHIKTNYWHYQRRLRFFAEMLAPGKRVLEIGCSSGFMLLPLQAQGLEVIGVEPSGGFVTFLKHHHIPVYATLSDLRAHCEITQFDLVLHFFVLEHVRHPISFLQEAYDLVGAGGHMIFEVPNWNDPLLSIYDIPAFQKFYWSVAHNYYFNRPSLEYILKKIAADYEIINEQRYDLSNHVTWALEGKPGGQGKYSTCFTRELEEAYRRSMVQTGYCDTLIGRIHKGRAGGEA